MASRPYTPPRVRAASLLPLTDEAASSPGGYGPIVLRGNSPNDRTQSGERSPKSPRRQMDTQHELTDSVTSQAMLARPGLGGLMRDDNGQSHSNQGAAAQRLSGSNSSHLGMSEETRSGMNGDGDDQEMLALPESAPRDLQLGFREARGVAEVGGVTKERCLEDLMRNDFRCKFTDGSLPCEESASEFMPFQGSLKGIEIGPGYYCNEGL